VCAIGRPAVRLPALAGLATSESVDASGNKVDPTVAAERVVKILEDPRKTARQEPLGAIVMVDVPLSGLKDRPVSLTWAMWNATDGSRLPGWLIERLAYELRAGTDRDSATVDLWVPLPTAGGRYIVDVRANVDGHGLAHGTSTPFD
jgi:hypothetical protein